MRYRRSSRVPWAVGVCCALAAALPVRAQLLAPVNGPVVRLERGEVPAAGRASVEFTVERFGRYTFRTVSAQGVALQLVRRTAGPGERSGVPGERDGRLDLWLEAGTYLIRTTGHPAASGTAKLEAQALEEANPDPLPQLVPLHPVDTTLEDGRQRSWWLKVKDGGKPVVLWAAGRALADLSLWRDGVWRKEVRVERRVVQPRPGKPLRSFQIWARLDPGLYLVTASGGAPEPWAEGEEAFPLHLRLGVPPLAAMARRVARIGPFGYDLWRVPGNTDLVRVDLEQVAPLELRVLEPGEETITGSVEGTATITKASREPVAEVQLYGGAREHLVVVEGTVGQKYLLQTLDRESSFRGPDRRAWVSVVRTGNPADTAPVTAMLRNDSGLQAVWAVLLGQGSSYHRRFNLEGRTEILLWVGQAGSYWVAVSGMPAKALLEPFPRPTDPHYRTPPPRPGRSAWGLEPGLWRLELTAPHPGIVTLDLAPGPGLAPLTHEPLPPILRPPIDTPVAQPVTIEPAFRTEVTFAHVPGVEAGLLLRTLPVDVMKGLPLVLRPAEVLEVPVQVLEASELVARTDEGKLLPVSVDGGPPRKRQRVVAGVHEVRISGPPNRTTVASLAAVPVRLLETTPLPPLPASVLAARPHLPEIQVGKPSYFELGRERSLDLLFHVEEAGYFTLESTGLLDLAGKLRDRTGTVIASADHGGSGRNFFIGVPLESGLYGLEVRTRGESAGDFGVVIRRRQPVDGGVLEPGSVRRARLEARRGLAYTVRFPKAGRYRLEVLSLGEKPRCRLDDARWWPLEPPGLVARFEREFPAGVHRLELLPADEDRTLVTVLRKLNPPPHFSGHGPHRLPLDVRVEHVWREPPKGGERVPDVWTFELPAAADLIVDLGPRDVVGRLLGPNDRELATVRPGRTPLDLPAGTYRLEVRAATENDRLPYSIRLTPDELLPGQRRTVYTPATVTLSVPSGVAAIETLSEIDTAARLLAPDGTVIATSDDRPDDWNPGLLTALSAGRYRLALQPLDRGGEVEVSLDLRPERKHPAARPPTHVTLTPGPNVEVIPLAPPPRGVLLLEARSASPVGVALERHDPSGWHVVGTTRGRVAKLEVPLGGAGLSLRVWSEEDVGEAVELSIATVDPKPVPIEKLGGGIVPAPPVRSAATTAVARVELGRAGVLALTRPVEGLRAGDRPGEPLRPVEGRLIAVPSGTVWLAVPKPIPIRGHRLVLGAERVSVPVPAGREVAVDLAPGEGFVRVDASGRAGTPLLAPPDGRFTACAPRAGGSTLVLDAAATTVRVRLGERDAAGLVTLGARRFPVPGKGALPGTANRLQVPERGTVLAASGESSPLRIVTTNGGAAALLERGRPTCTLGGGEAGVTELEASFDGIVLLPGTEGPQAAEVVLLAPGELPGRFSDVAAVRPAGRSAVVRLPLAGGDERPLRIAGRGAVGRLVTAGGGLRTGVRFAPEAGDTVLWLEHGASLALLWRGDLGETLGRLPPPKACTPPCRVTADGDTLALALAPTKAAVATVELAPGSVYRLEQDGRTVDGFVALDAPHHLFLEPGPATLAVRVVVPGAAARARVSTSPVLAAGEGMGPPVALAAGESVAFRFSLPEKGQVGIGVRAVPDTVRVHLLDGEGAAVGEGVVQFHELEAGDYVVLVEQPTEAGPATVRLVLAGLSPPSSGPPEETVRHYLELSGRIR